MSGNKQCRKDATFSFTVKTMFWIPALHMSLYLWFAFITSAQRLCFHPSPLAGSSGCTITQQLLERFWCRSRIIVLFSLFLYLRFPRIKFMDLDGKDIFRGVISKSVWNMEQLDWIEWTVGPWWRNVLYYYCHSSLESFKFIVQLQNIYHKGLITNILGINDNGLLICDISADVSDSFFNRHQPSNPFWTLV